MARYRRGSRSGHILGSRRHPYKIMIERDQIIDLRTEYPSDEEFYEEDEDPRKIEAIWNRPGKKGRTVKRKHV